MAESALPDDAPPVTFGVKVTRDDGPVRVRHRGRRRGHSCGGVCEWDVLVGQLEEQARRMVANETLGEATRSLRWVRENGPIACACVGPPYCCRYGWRQSEALHRAAHILVRQLADLRDRLAP